MLRLLHKISVKKYVFFVIGCISFPLWAAGTKTYDSFVDSLQMYRPNAPWITEELMFLPLNDFNRAWSELIDIFTKQNRRWFYFCDTEKDFHQDNYWYQCLLQCKYYDSWLETVVVNKKDTGQKKKIDLLYLREIDENNLETVVPLAKYWQDIAEQQDIKEPLAAYYQFYAYYFDCVSHFFCQSVFLSYQYLTDDELYKSTLKAGKLCLKKINSLLYKLKNSPFHDKYQIVAKRYTEIMNLLESEYLERQIELED